MQTKIGKNNFFDDYDKFLEKFEHKKTTDDCYTPKEVYQLVLDYVNENYNLEGKEIIRPFFPDGDFENIDYPSNAVVIDNPPFSIISKIAKFYVSKKIPFFLFAPHLTLFGSDVDCTHIVACANIKYDNGAMVKTSFLSNMFGDVKILGDANLCKRFKELEQKNKVSLPKYQYPSNVLTVSQVTTFVEAGISLKIDKIHTKHCRALQSQKLHKKAIFGAGFLLSEQAKAEKEKAEKEKAKKEKAKKEKAEKEKVIIWELSQKELDIIKQLG